MPRHQGVIKQLEFPRGHPLETTKPAAQERWRQQSRRLRRGESSAQSPLGWLWKRSCDVSSDTCGTFCTCSSDISEFSILIASVQSKKEQTRREIAQNGPLELSQKAEKRYRSFPPLGGWSRVPLFEMWWLISCR